MEVGKSREKLSMGFVDRNKNRIVSALSLKKTLNVKLSKTKGPNNLLNAKQRNSIITHNKKAWNLPVLFVDLKIVGSLTDG